MALNCACSIFREKQNLFVSYLKLEEDLSININVGLRHCPSLRKRERERESYRAREGREREGVRRERGSEKRESE